MSVTMKCGPEYPKKALLEVLKGIVQEIDNKPCNQCTEIVEFPTTTLPKAPQTSPACSPPIPNSCRRTCRKPAPPLISEPDYGKRDKEYIYYIPLPPPMKVRSRELIAGNLYHGCMCGRRNGLQDDCRRWDCRGSPYCCKQNICKNSGGSGCDGTLCEK